MAEIIPIRAGSTGGVDGDGPEDPMLEQRVGRLEEKFDRIEATVTRIDGVVTQILEIFARQSGDLQKLQADIVEIKATGAKQTDLNKLQLEVAEIKASGAKQIDLNKAQVELAEVKGRVSALPTWWMLITAILATWGAGFAIANSIAKTPISMEKIQEKASPK